MNALEKYLDSILLPQLASFAVPEAAICKVSENIKEQMYSFFQIWNDTTIRNTILLIGLKEGSFYSADASVEVKCFVVVTIRNSMLETLASVGCTTLNMSQMLSDDNVKEITSKAVDYFSELDFDKLSLELNYDNINNVYLNVKEKYPTAWNAVEVLAISEKCNTHFPKTKASSETAMLTELNSFCCNENTAPEKPTVSLDGYSDILDNDLLYYLKNVYTNPKAVFVSSCFKMISRNIDKLFRVMDFVLCCNKVCITANYLISNGHVERRNPILRASHSDDEATQKLCNYEGLQTKHARILKEMLA